MAYLKAPNGLLIPAQFAEPTPARPESREIATTRDGRDITRGFVSPMELLLPQDDILRARGAGNLQIYREVLRDDQVASVFHQRRMAVIAREWEVRPGGTMRRDKQAALFLEQQLRRVNWDAVTERMLYGTFYGYAVAEALWGRDGDRVVLDAIRVRDRRRFAFDADMRLRLLTSTRPNPGEEVPPGKFWWYATGADHDDEPYGLGLAHWLFWPVMFKRQGLKFWLIFLEKFGQPTATGKYPINATPDEKQRLLSALGAIQTDAGIIIPEGMAIELLEAARSGTADYTALYDRMNAAISKVVLGHTGSSDATPGRLGGESNAADVRLDLVKADADLISHSFNCTVARWLTDWNFPGAAYPEVWRIVEEPEDLNGIAERDERLTRIGFRPTLARVQTVYGPDYEDVGAAPPAAAPPSPPVGEGEGGGGGTAAADLAETPDIPRRTDTPAPSDLITERLAREAQPAVGDWIATIETMLERAESLEEFREMLIAAYPELPITAFGNALTEATFAAHAAGRFDVEERGDRGE